MKKQLKLFLAIVFAMSIALMSIAMLTACREDEDTSQIPTNLTATFGDVLSSVELPNGWEWYQDAMVGDVGDNVHYAVFNRSEEEIYYYYDYEVEKVPLTVTVKRAVLTVTINDTWWYAGEEKPVITYTISGFKTDDHRERFDGAFLIETEASSTSPVGTVYPITISQGTFVAPNYEIVFINGQIDIRDRESE
ncbi:MAG: hypothetical protein FWE22_02050 [Firmicutes bacterium]|nr:hypothetical protein [Bacillota bacterium]